MLASIDFPRFVLLAGLACWLWIAVINNIRDRGTNVFLLGIMFGMKLLKEDPMLGNGLKHRAKDSPLVAANALTLIVLYQIFTGLLLTIATISMASRMFGYELGEAIALANLAIAAFAGLWFFFMSGGLWFGYWMKQQPVQQVHMTLVLFSMGMFILVNLPG